MAFGYKERKGSAGRVPDSMIDGYVRYSDFHITMPPELAKRFCAYAEAEERAKSWVIQKALDEFLTGKGY